MTEEELRQRMKAYVQGWKEVDEYLEAERRERLRKTDTAKSVAIFGELFNAAVRTHRPDANSGMVEFYRVLSKASE